MTATLDSCSIQKTVIGYMVVRDNAPVPPQVHPPAVLVFAQRDHARQLAAALNDGKDEAAHYLIARYGRWWSE